MEAVSIFVHKVEIKLVTEIYKFPKGEIKNFKPQDFEVLSKYGLVTKEIKEQNHVVENPDTVNLKYTDNTWRDYYWELGSKNKYCINKYPDKKEVSIEISYN